MLSIVVEIDGGTYEVSGDVIFEGPEANVESLHVRINDEHGREVFEDLGRFEDALVEEALKRLERQEREEDTAFWESFDRIHFADPTGRSALRAATPNNPRNCACPTCGAPDRLTPADVERGYQCDPCANADERDNDRSARWDHYDAIERGDYDDYDDCRDW